MCAARAVTDRRVSASLCYSGCALLPRKGSIGSIHGVITKHLEGEECNGLCSAAVHD